jgi:glycosyltransferase involved in cell wall biosynthesis
MPEVCGDAVEYFDPTDIIDMANVIEFVLLNANRRPELVQMGERRASAFSWYRAAEQYYRVLSKIGKRA